MTRERIQEWINVLLFLVPVLFRIFHFIVSFSFSWIISHKIIPYILCVSLYPLIIHYSPETWTISESQFFIIFPVGVYITEENPTSPGLNPKENHRISFSCFQTSKPNKNRIKRSFFWLGKIRTGSNPSRKLP